MSEAGAAAASGDGSAVLAALEERPGGHALLALGREREDLALVGGAVRDLLLGRDPRELDVVLAGEPATLARELAVRLGAHTLQEPPAPASETLHERFGTAVVEWHEGRIDIARRRAESYPRPGALPEVRPGTVEEDLQRRDFTVNAIAVPLAGPAKGELLSAGPALADLAAGRLRILHERSFLDDPTRLLRLARYHARLGFEVEEHTAELAAAALAAGALETVSRPRVGAELRLALGEGDPVASLLSMQELGVLAALHEGIGLDAELARRALELLPGDARTEVLLLGLLLLPLSVDAAQDPRPEMFELLDAMEFTAGERDAALATALAAPGLPEAMRSASRPSELYAALAGQTAEAIALGAALGERSALGASMDTADVAREWFERLREVRLAIGGDDLLAAGIPAGPEVGERLAAALRLRLDGELPDGAEAELRAALEDRP